MLQRTVKLCPTCETEKSIDDFYVDQVRGDGHDWQCKECRRARIDVNASTLTVDRKTCSTCHETKSVSEFHKNKHKADGYQSQCKPCRNAHHRAIYRGVTISKSTPVRQWLEAYKEQLGCADCPSGTFHPAYRLDFDHLRDKHMNISRMVNSGRSQEDILVEIEKCELVCANCHRDRTHRRVQERYQ